MADRRARRRSAIDNDERILDAAVRVATAEGADRLTASAVAAAAGFTSGAIYARYGQREEILVAIWEHRARASLERLVLDVGTFRRRGSSPTDRQRIVDWLAAPPPELLIAIELCLVAHRIDELSEIIPDSVRSSIAQLGLDGTNLAPDEAVDLATLAGTIGYVMLQPFEAPLAADLDAALRWVSPTASIPIGDRLPPIETAQDLLMQPDDPVHNDLLLAAQSVIARSGVHRTTLARIGRVARLAPATVYGRYQRRDDLIADILVRAQQHQATTARRLEWFSGEAQMAAALEGFLQPEGLVRRRVNSETIVAAWHDPAVADGFAREEWSSMRDVAAMFPGGLVTSDRLLQLQQTALMAIHGSAALLEVLPSMARLDWRPAAHLLVQAALASD